MEIEVLARRRADTIVKANTVRHSCLIMSTGAIFGLAVIIHQGWSCIAVVVVGIGIAR